MWPLEVAVLWGALFLNWFLVRQGKLMRKPLSIDLAKVEFFGENNDAWLKATMSAVVAEGVVHPR